MGELILLRQPAAEPEPRPPVADPLDLIVDLQRLLKWAPAEVVADVIVYARSRARQQTA